MCVGNKSPQPLVGCDSVPSPEREKDICLFFSLLYACARDGTESPLVSSGNLPPHVAGAADTALAGFLQPIVSRPVASDRASPGVPQRHAWADERTSERRAEDEGRAVAYAIVQHAGQRD